MIESRLMTLQEFFEFEETRRMLFCNTLIMSIKQSDPNVTTDDINKIVDFELKEDIKSIYENQMVYYHKEGIQ